MAKKIPKYTNIVLSSNPCPICIRANGKTMTLAKWKVSPYGLTDSKKRYCNIKTASCHCILVPEDMVSLLPDIGKKIKLRGDKVTDIKHIVDIHPNEMALEELMNRYIEEIGTLPPEIYEMAIGEIAPYLIKLLP